MSNRHNNFGSIQKRLPDAVLVELIEILFTGLLPTVIIGVAVALIGALIAATENDLSLWLLTAFSVVLSIIRIGVILAYQRRRTDVPMTIKEARVWERRYAVGSLSFAILIGVMNARELMMAYPLIPMLITGLIFGYGAGLVTRVAVRPMLCFASLLLATVPTVVSFAVHVSGAARFDTMAGFAVQTLLLVGFTAASLETVSHIYGTTVTQLRTKRDLAALAGRDALTGLHNRIRLRARFDEDALRSEKTGDLMAIHCLDLDRFKAVNDTFGHPTGDGLLQAVAQRLLRTLQAGDTAARLGGDEFVVIQPGIHDPDEARMLAHRIIRVLSEPYSIDGHEVRIGVSLGIAFAPQDGTDLEHLTACADVALYRAKGAGRGVVVVSGDPFVPVAKSSAA